MPQLRGSLRHLGNSFYGTREPGGMAEKTAYGGACRVDGTAAVFHVSVPAEGNRDPGILGAGPGNDLILRGDPLHLRRRLGPEIRLYSRSLRMADLEAIHAAQAAAVAAVADFHRHLGDQCIPRTQKPLPRSSGGISVACAF